MWWDGQVGKDGDWMIGDYSDMDENLCWLANDQDTACPSHSEHWKEYYNSEWAAAVNVHVSCYGA